MKYSIISVESTYPDAITGSWVQNHIGTTKTVETVMASINSANGNMLRLIATDELACTTPQLTNWVVPNTNIIAFHKGENYA